MDAAGRFCAVWLMSVAVLLFAAVSVNAVIDPYDVLGTPRIAGVNEFKVTAPRHTQLTKEFQIKRLRPTTVLLGSSGVDLGLDPDSSLWPKAIRPVYNFGVPGIAVSGIYRNLRIAAATGRLKHAFVGLDFENFIGGDEVRTDDQERNSLSLDYLRDLAAVTFSYSALLDSIETLAEQHSRTPEDVSANGGTNEGGFRAVAAADGEYALFAQKRSEYEQHLKQVAAVYLESGSRFANMDILRAIIAFCETHNISLTFFMPPSHAEKYDLLKANGLWTVREKWKHEITTIAQGKNDISIPIWDFGGYNAYTTEAVPSDGDRRTETKWFWEPGHFKRELGEKILKAMLTGASVDFGIPLTATHSSGELETEHSGPAADHCGLGPCRIP